jgi:beta-glucosidase
MIGQYVTGVQSTGTIATLKHFAANNTDYFRRRSNSIVDERTLHEIYLPGFKAGIDAGAKAVMTSYNQLNGEWCGQSAAVIDTVLRKQLGFQWLVMTDWWSVYDGEKLAKSGQDLEMPLSVALKDAQQLLREGKVQEKDITRMAKSILRTYFAMKFDERDTLRHEQIRYDEHETVALQTAREGIVLLRNDGSILPIKDNVKTILLTGDFVKKLAMGGGSAMVKGFNIRLMFDELQAALGDRLRYSKEPSVHEIQAADVVLCNVGTEDSEGSDRPFALPEAQETLVQKCVNNNSNTVVIVTSGSGVRMTGWNEKAKAILYAWYVGQIGNKALAEIITGKVNPSGKLPITIEREFQDSPGFGYIPEGETVNTGWNDKNEAKHPVYNIPYTEGIFTGYRWYDNKNIAPLYPFGFGLSYTTFEYQKLAVSQERFHEEDTVHVNITVKNTGSVLGTETVQLYVQDVECSVPRPVKELKGFKKISLKPGESGTVDLLLQKKDFSFWDTNIKNWKAERGTFVLWAASSSKDVQLKKEIVLE